MKHHGSKKFLLVAALLYTLVSPARAQGTFQNLDFEAASIPPGTPANSLVPISEGLPGWTAYFGVNQTTQVLYNNLDIGSTMVAVLAPGSPFSLPPIIQGNYMVVLQGGVSGPATIAQTGTISALARTLLFTASLPTGSGWTVTVGGQYLPVVPISPFGTIYETYGVDVSALAGQTEELRFNALVGSSFPGSMALDNIQFSTTPIPEPATWALLVCGAGAIAFGRRRQKNETTTS